ncbi:MAG: NAD(P)-dependent oxidoreductase [Rhodoferax sp.]|uniref:NAD(P)-dependent oxidoreductase n=1 Tax=Rhodoferax sp. TaxID=50421 RepID=UPI0026119AEF|nr:NAD(P)-dependent oxidoreductase [Rhodoferax sp.]MDD2880843.1 NAD(P)-dependent oxidoreductase [Rhodoferax sp.]
MTKLTLGFVGLGAMGQNAARNLLQAGHQVQGYDLRTESLQAFAEQGGQVVSSPALVCANAVATVLFVVNAAQAEAVLFDTEGIASSATPGHLVISCVTMSAADARHLSVRCREAGLVFVDAPVSGGVAGAEAGSLSIMAAGPAPALDACAPVFAAMGSRVLNVGTEAGQGSTFKTINQLLCGVHLAAAGEAMAMAARAGLDTSQVFDLVSESAAASWMLRDRGPAMVTRSYTPTRSAVDIFVKDLGLVVDLARDLRFPATVSAAALQSFLGASGAGFGKQDDAAVTEFYRLGAKNHE